MNENLKKLLKSYYIFVKDFFYKLFDDKIGYYASSLSWDTIFAIIPLMAIFVYIFTSLPSFDLLFKKFEIYLFSIIIPSNSKYISDFLEQFLNNADQLGILGFIYVIFAVTLFFKTYDYIVNDIFETGKRGIWSAVKIYLLFIVIISIVVGLSTYISFFIEEKMESNFFIGSSLPFIITWGIFFLSYQLSPNTKISLKASISSSFIASFIWFLSKKAFILYAYYNQTYTTIYGSISIVLFFFLWIYISWAIFLHGMRFCYLLNKGEDID
ncbi:MAG: YihY family inner membrane protein [Sulfurovaceae bacterium]|nr:YihY family inner membrane protein [Sulfurovaceae bacterium]MDD5548601.1 YihY family inner membrane protein [Sulfurovaceae bacterium]